MKSISLNQFRKNLEFFVEQIAANHRPLKVTCRGGADFVVVSAEDWEQERETLYVLQNSELMCQIQDSLVTHLTKKKHSE